MIEPRARARRGRGPRRPIPSPPRPGDRSPLGAPGGALPLARNREPSGIPAPRERKREFLDARRARRARWAVVVALGLALGATAAIAARVAKQRREAARLAMVDALTESCRIDRFALRDTEGKTHTPDEWREFKAVVLFVLGAECPASAGSAPTIRRIAGEYRDRGIGAFGVYPDPDLSAETARRLGTGLGLTFPLLLDPCQELTRDLGVRRTPEAVVLDPDGTVLYRGAIDAPRPTDTEVPESPLERAVRAVVAGRMPPVAEDSSAGCSLPHPRPIVAEGETITYTKHVAPILQQHCLRCHRAGEVGPFSLATYRDAAKRADFLREITACRRMPPWRPVRGFGAFRDETALSRREIETLARWSEAGATEGDPADLPPAPSFPSGWDLGTPDLVLTPSEPFTIPADGDDIYRAFVLPIPLDRDQPIAAVVFRPDNRHVVHHSRIYVDETEESRDRDADDPGPGFEAPGGGIEIRKTTVGHWIPGMVARFPPEGVGRIIAAGSSLVVLIHYHPTGKPEIDRSSVGLHFRKTPPTRTMASIPLSTAKIDIPPGVRRHRIGLSAVVPADVHAYSLLPHGHRLMREIKLAAILPDGTVRRLLWIKDWDYNWQGQYHFARPIALPKGTRLEVIAYYDNSEDNPANPFHPPQRVQFGLQSTDEMLNCHVQVIADRPEDSQVLNTKWPESL